MQAFTERVRQALGLGSDVFVASSLDAHEATLRELADFAAPLRAIEKATGQFNQDTAEFLQATATLMECCPFPRLWSQPSPTEPAVPVHVLAPADAAAWLDADTHALLSKEVPGAVGMAVRSKLLSPMRQWLAAYDVAQAQLASVQSGRLAYDATRRHLVSAAAKAAKDADATPPASPRAAPAANVAASTAAPAAAVAGPDEEGSARPPDVLLVSGGQQLAQLQEVAAATSPELAEYEANVEALDDTLAWLAGGAARIKAALADAGGSAAAAAEAWHVPPGLLPPLPEKSSIGKDIDITMTLTDSPRSAEQAAAQVATSITSTTAGDAAITIHPKEDSSTSSSSSSSSSDRAGHAGVGAGEQQQGAPDLSAMLPQDDSMVYGGGVPPSPTAAAHHPTGGGPGQLIKDTLAGPSTADTANNDEAEAADTAELSAAAGAEGVSSAGSELSTDEQLADELFQGSTPAANEAAEAADEPADLPAAAAPEVVPRPSRSYSGEGVGQHEEGPAAAAAAARSGSGGMHGGRTFSGPGLAMQPAVQVAEPERKQLSTVVLPASGEQALAAAAAAAATHDMPFSGAQGTAAASSSSSNSGGGGGLLAAIARTIEQGGTAIARTVEEGGSHFIRLMEGAVHSEQQQQQQQQQQEEGKEELVAEEAGGEVHTGSSGSSGVKFEVQGAESAGAPGAPGTPSSSAVEQQQQQQQHAAPGSEMHIGPVAPFPGHQASPASAEFAKGASPPGGAAAAAAAADEAGGDRQEQDQHRMAEEAAEAGTDMHIGPVAPFPGHQASPASAEFAKGASPPGGAAASDISAQQPTAAAAGAAAGDDEQQELAGTAAGGEMHIGPVAPFPGHQASPASAEFAKGASPPGGAAAAAAAAEAPAGDATTPTAGSQQQGPDLSAILPAYKQLPAGGAKAKPSGGGVGALLRDTLLGPRAEQ